ncbi:MAG: efflux RND transporter periplasmic adaptor subunit [Cyclobacteriaceae bacterium]
MKKIIYTIMGMMAVTVMSCGGGESPEVAQLTPIAVKVGKTTDVGVSNYVSASGKIAATNSANLSTRMMGFVQRMNVKVGDDVKKGEVLVSINNADLLAKKAQVEASIIQATAGYENAKKDFERFKTLFSQGSASPKELDDMTTRYEMAKAGLEAAEQMKAEVQAQFAYTNIKAPFSGVVSNTFIKEGDMASPGMPLVAIESPAALEVTAMVSESDIDHIETGVEVKVFVKTVNQVLQGAVTEVSHSAKNTGGQYLVKVNLPKTDEDVLPGMFVNVQFPVSEKAANTKVLLPNKALLKQGQLTGVYTVGAGNVAILRWLRIGKVYGSEVEVLSGLAQGEEYILSAEGKLFNGAKVTF